MDEGDPPPPVDVQLRLDGFAGPLDLLLELARRQEVDLGQISVTALVDQYLSATSDIGRIDLARAADWLVMAAWLVWLKSRLLLPKDVEEARQAETAAKTLTDRLAALERIRTASAWLERRPQLGHDIFGRGYHDDIAPIRLESAGYVALLEAALAVLQATLPPEPPEPSPPPRPKFWTPYQALARMRQLVAELPDGSDLFLFVPKLAPDVPALSLRTRVAVCSTLVAGLELARGAEIRLQQAETWGTVTVHAAVGMSAAQDTGSQVSVDA
jgi:segregation and condensation protein A